MLGLSFRWDSAERNEEAASGEVVYFFYRPYIDKSGVSRKLVGIIWLHQMFNILPPYYDADKCFVDKK